MRLTAFADRHKNTIHTIQLRSLLAEFTGTFLLTFFALAASAVVGFQDAFLNQILACFSIGGITFLTTFFLYSVSGSHFNPAVSVGFFIANRIGFSKLVVYICTHIISGLLATLLVFFLFSDNRNDSILLFSTPVVPHHPESLMLSSVCQSVMMFIVLLLFLGLTYLQKGRLYMATFMAIAIGIANFVNLSITSYPLNPAMTAGELLLFRKHEMLDAVIVWLSPFAGACMAGIIYFITFIRPVH
ncbi:glycerol uptake facilitator-like aquaporin [Flavobacterium endophyticum]|uniref:Glycerol uptake facilitator-like aquaporin n=1 Tax=Flavobacterium endophyticum TaxID=1540163 RepID=A0A495LZV5_9FLAO|nr:aquaporin [Flavobacterium endophyticum]RKS19161.1 glycerol uptake facilitator-like aquaporin [Flavobacterium endophyticum]